MAPEETGKYKVRLKDGMTGTIVVYGSLSAKHGYRLVVIFHGRVIPLEKFNEFVERWIKCG